MTQREYSSEEAAKILHVTRTTIGTWIKEGKLKAYKLPGGRHRIPHEFMVEFMKEFGIPMHYLDAGKRRVLLVEDDEALLRGLLKAFERDGRYEVATSSNGFDAGYKTRQFHPHVIVLDIKLPDLDGREVCKMLRSVPDFSDVKLIAISGYLSDAEIKDLDSVGFDTFLAKPFSSEDLISRVTELLNVGVV